MLKSKPLEASFQREKEKEQNVLSSLSCYRSIRVNFQSTLNPNAAEFFPAIKSASVSTSSEVSAESSSKPSLTLPAPV